MSRTGSEFMYTYKRHNFKQFETLSKFQAYLSPDCLLMFSVVLPPVAIHDQRDRQFQN